MGYALNERELAYIDARVSGMKPHVARTHVGYHPSYANVERKPEVQEEIRRRMSAKREEEDKASEVTLRWWLEELRQAVKAAKIDEDRPNLLKALDMIGKHLGAYERDNATKAPLVVIGQVNIQERLAAAEERRGALIEQQQEALPKPDQVDWSSDGD